MKIVKKIIIGLITIILSLILIYNIYNFVNLKILKKDLSTLNGYAVLEVISGSMEPTLNIGDYIVINTKIKDVKENDIITFKDINGAFVTHRLVSINDNTIITKGDNNNTVDEEMPASSLIGKYLFKINGLGKLMASLKNPLVSIMIFIIGILICFLISTDKEGNAILDSEEKEFLEYLEEKEGKDKKSSFFDRIKNLFKKKKKVRVRKKKKKRVKKKSPKKMKKKKRKRK